MLFLGLSLMAEWVQAGDKPAPRQTLVVLGDSLSAGYGVDPEEAYPALLQKKVEAARMSIRVVNSSVSGDTTAGGLRRLDWILKQPVDILLIELGGNDGLRGLAPSQTRSNIQGMIDKARTKYPGVRLVIAGMQMPDNLGADYQNAFRTLFADLARTNGATLIPFLLEGVGGVAKLNQPDRIHPTAEGHVIVAETVWKSLQPLLLEPAAAGGKASP